MSGRGLLVGSLLLATACHGDPDSPPQVEAGPRPGVEAVTPEQALARARSQSRGLRIIWFGHSLMKVRGGTPIDVPATVDAIHDTARTAGRSDLPPALTRTHYEGPHDLSYWLDGPGRGPEKLRDDGIEWDYAVGIGFMHLVGAGRKHPRLFGLLARASPRFKTYQAFTSVKYRWIREVRDLGPHAVWLNYVGPRLADHADEQPYVDERFECIRETALAAGGRVDSVPVGRAFRNAESAALERPQLGIRLQGDDRLHYTKQGEFLAANVFFDYLYAVDPTGLPVPPALSGQLVASGDEAEVASFLQRIAHETVEAQRRGERPTCRTESRLDEDEAGRLLLSGP